MKRVLCVFCVLCGLSWSAFGLDRHAFTFTDYNLIITLEPAKSGFSAEGTVTLRNDTTEPQKTVVLQISSSLDWKSITLGGKPVQYVSQPYVSDIDHTGALSEAIVSLAAPVPPSGTIRLQIAYAGTIAQDSTRLTRIGVPAKVAAQSDWDRISDPYTAMRGVGYVAWYPIATEAQSLSDGTTVFREIGAWQQRERNAAVLISVGVIGPPVAIRSNANPQPDCAYIGPLALVKELRSVRCFWSQGFVATSPALVIGKYEHLARPQSEIDFLPGHQQFADDYARVIAALTPVVTQWFGDPTEPVQVVELAWPDAASWESGTMFLIPLKQSLTEPLQVQLIHQLTHAALSSPRPWIYEGVAEFAQALERERQSGRRAAIEFMKAQTAPLQAAQQPTLPNAPGQHDTTPPRRLEPLATTTDEVFYRIKGMRVWWMLRDMIGDAALQRALHNYKAQDDREPSYLQRLIEAETLRKLEWFFDDWVYRDRGLPDFRIDSVYPRPTLAGGYTVTITVENRGDAGAEVPVTVETSHGQFTRRLEVRGQQKGFVRIEVPEAPKRVVVNDGSVPEQQVSSHTFEVKIPSAH